MADRQWYATHTNLPGEVNIQFKAFLDAANQPTLAASPQNLYISSIVRVSQGLFRITLRDQLLYHSSTSPTLNVNGAGVVRFAQPGPVANFGTSAACTVDIQIVDAAGAVQDPPAANANNFLAGTIVCGEIKSV